MERRSNKYRDYVLTCLAETEYLVFVDTETTGLSKDSQIIQFSGIRYFRENTSVLLNEVDRIDLYIRPYEPIHDKITQVTGITNKKLNGYPYENERFPIIHKFIDSNGILAGYNFGFDMAKLEALYERNHTIFPHSVYIDVLEMARDIIPKSEVSNYKLSTVAEYLDCMESLTAHSAMDDTIMTKRVFEKLLPHYIHSVLHEDREKEKVKLRYLFYWENPHQKSMTRIICETSAGRIYYDTIAKCWGVNADSKLSIKSFDLDHLEEQCLFRYQVTDMYALIKLLKKKKHKKLA